MNICKDEAKFNNFRILLDSGYSSTIVTRIPIEKLNPKKDTVTWNCHVGDSAKGRYDLILGRYLLMELRLNI